MLSDKLISVCPVHVIPHAYNYDTYNLVRVCMHINVCMPMSECIWVHMWEYMYLSMFKTDIQADK